MTGHSDLSVYAPEIVRGDKGVGTSFLDGLAKGMELFGFAFPFIVTAIAVWFGTILIVPMALARFRSKLSSAPQEPRAATSKKGADE